MLYGDSISTGTGFHINWNKVPYHLEQGSTSSGTKPLAFNSNTGA
ncbi:hypothetical protein HMPREF6745_3048 [Prevotella sp. oral taxon 472 str. F0295]|nr:hypothetical protein HMPREF6745_3048 [Prevotella sp. oral taxon 472 str. F0295]